MVNISRDAEALQGKNAQRAKAKRATLDALRNKKRAENEFSITLNGDEVSFLFRAIGATEYDNLLTKFPPTLEQKAEGATYDQDRFAPALLAAVCADPALSAEEWREIWTSPDWNRGEVGQLFWTAVELCNKGLDFTPTAAD